MILTDIVGTPVLGILRANLRFLTLVNVGFSALAASVLQLLAVFVTVLVAVGSSVINDMGSGLSVSVKAGGSFLAMAWVAAVLSSVAGLYWFLVWFVEFRRTSLARRGRTSHEIGNWRGILGEIKRDIRIKTQASHSDKH